MHILYRMGTWAGGRLPVQPSSPLHALFAEQTTELLKGSECPVLSDFYTKHMQ